MLVTQGGALRGVGRRGAEIVNQPRRPQPDGPRYEHLPGDFVEWLQLFGIDDFKILSTSQRFALDHGQPLLHHFSRAGFAGSDFRNAR